MRSPGVLWIKAAVVYLVMGVGLGIYMGASGNHVMVPVHAHLNLLGVGIIGATGLDPFLGLASMIIGSAIVLFAINVFQRIR